LIDKGTTLTPIEIKSAETLHPDFFLGLNRWNQLAGQSSSNSYVVYGGKDRQARSQGVVIGWNHLSQLFENLLS
jgi:uncharacterized protein